jgi:hypothetical protein
LFSLPHRPHLDPFERDLPLECIYYWRYPFDRYDFNLKRINTEHESKGFLGHLPAIGIISHALAITQAALIYSKRDSNFIYLFRYPPLFRFAVLVYGSFTSQPAYKQEAARRGAKHCFGGLTDKPAEHKRKAVTALYSPLCCC